MLFKEQPFTKRIPEKNDRGLARMFDISDVALWGQAAKADESVLARNQTKDSWT